jgi:hypothetical protein
MRGTGRLVHRIAETDSKRPIPKVLGMLMTRFVSKLRDHGVHLVLEMELFLLQPDLFDVFMLRHMVAAVQFGEPSFILFMFLDQTAEFRVRGHQVFLDLLLLHHHHAPPIGMETLTLRPP